MLKNSLKTLKTTLKASLKLKTSTYSEIKLFSLTFYLLALQREL